MHRMDHGLSPPVPRADPPERRPPVNAPYHLILLVLALVCFGLSIWTAAPAPDPWWRRLISIGLFAATLAFIVP
jgi:hypothetical protein